MKKIVLSLIIVLGFIVTASAQRTTARPNERRMERRMEMRRIHRMERRHLRRRHQRVVSQINPTMSQRSQAVLYKSGTTAQYN